MPLSGSLNSAQLVQSSLKLTSEQRSQIRDLAARVLKHADSAGCKKSCTILVANFTGETGSTFAAGMQLADEVSAQLAAQANSGVQIASRLHLQQYLEKERIPSKLLEGDNAARWLATENGATAVLIGYLKLGLTQASLHVQLLDTRDFGKRDIRGKTYVDEQTFGDIGDFGALEPAEPFGALSKPELDGEIVEPLPKDVKSLGVPFEMPTCFYKPDPPYTPSARSVKFSGRLVLQTIISEEGTVVSVHPAVGAPFGLNAISVKTVSTWKCHPTKKDNKPIAAAVPIEITFRLF
jgi:hypothetical protein